MGLLIIPSDTDNNSKPIPSTKRANKKAVSNVSRIARSSGQIKKRNASPKKSLLLSHEPSGFTYISEDSGLGVEIMNESKDVPVEGHTVLPESELLPELADHDLRSSEQQAPLLDAALDPERDEPEQDQMVAVAAAAAAACAPTLNAGPQPQTQDDHHRTLPISGQESTYRHRMSERCPTPAWCQDGSGATATAAAERPQSPGKRKLPVGFSPEEDKRRRVEGTKTPLEELSELGSRAPEQFAANPIMQPNGVFGGAFDACGNLDDGAQDFGADGFDSDSMDSDESDSSLPSDEESDSEVDSDSAEWFESGPPRADEELCRKNWSQHVYANKSAQCWDKARVGPPNAAEGCCKPNCPCSDELYLRRHSAYHRRRQVVFNLSVSKLGRYRQAANPSLLRSVLVCNTLRNLEKEFEKEGVRFSVGAHGNLVITRSCPPNNRASTNCNSRPLPTWSQRRMLRQAAQGQGHGQGHGGPAPVSQDSQHSYQWGSGGNVRDCGSCGNCGNCANQIRSSHCFQCGKPHSMCRNSCRTQDYHRSQENGWQSDYRQSDYDYWQRCRYRRPGFNRWPSPTPRYPADYKERIYRDYRDEYVELTPPSPPAVAGGGGGGGGRQPSPSHPQNQHGQNHQQMLREGFQGYHEPEWTSQPQHGHHPAQGAHGCYNPRYPVRDPRANNIPSKDLSQPSTDERYGGSQKDPHASSVLFADLSEDSGRLTPFVAFRDEPLTDYDTVDRLLNSVSVLNFGNTVPVATPVAAEDSSENMANSQLLTLTTPWKSPPHPEGSHSQDGLNGSQTLSLVQSGQCQEGGRTSAPSAHDNQLLTLTTPWKSPPHENNNPMFGASAEKVSEDSTYGGDVTQGGQDRYADMYAKAAVAQPLQPSAYQDFQPTYTLQDMTPRYGNCKDSWEAEWNQEWPSYWGMPEEGRSVLAS